MPSNPAPSSSRRRSWGKILGVLGLSAGLSGCATDPAFWNVVSAGLDYAAYSALLDQTSCRRRPSACGYGHDRHHHRPEHRARRLDGDRPHRGPPRPPAEDP